MMVNNNIRTMVDAALSGDYVTSQQAFNSEMSTRVSDYLDAKKQEVAQNFFEDLNEGTMTPAQKSKSEIIIHGLKKETPDFKKRYGNRWKNVMYAVANKEAKKEA